MIQLYVWFRTPWGAILRAGELRVAEPNRSRGGLLHGEFRYDAAYIDHPATPALDPLHLLLENGIVGADRPHSGLHGVFEDSLPDVPQRREHVLHFGHYGNLPSLKATRYQEGQKGTDLFFSHLRSRSRGRRGGKVSLRACQSFSQTDFSTPD